MPEDRDPPGKGLLKSTRRAPVVDRSTLVRDIVVLSPQAAGIMAAYGLHCSGCSVGGIEPLGEGCAMHGFDDETIDALIEDLNDDLLSMPEKPRVLIVTQAAAEALSRIAEAEAKTAFGLAVVSDDHGGFCMEFRSEPEEGDHIFFHDKHPHVRVFASDETLWRIGGSTIDFRSDRFKLDLPGEDCGKGCACDGCDCGK